MTDKLFIPCIKKMNFWKDLRDKKNLSIEEVHMKTQIPKNTLRNLESRGVKALNPNYICRLSILYDGLTDYYELMSVAGYEIPEMKRSNMDMLLQGFSTMNKSKIKSYIFYIKNEDEIKNMIDKKVFE